jgi:O-antigen/teichoic acid export membrane protein
MSSPNKFITGIGTVGLINILAALKGIILLPILTKSLGTENFGVWSQIMVTFGLITPIAILGLPYALVRFLPAEKDKEEIKDGIYSVLALVFIVTFLIALFFILLSEPIGNFLQSPPILIRILAITIIFECLNLVLLNVLVAFQKMNIYFYLMIFSIFGELSLIAGTITLGYKLKEVLISFLIIRIITFLALFSFIFKEIGVKIPSFRKIKDFLAFGLPTVTSGIAYWIIGSSDRYLIGLFLGISFVGYYSPAYSMGNLINFFIYPFAIILPPTLSKLFDENKNGEVKKYLKYSLKYFLLIAIPAVFGFSVLDRQLLVIFSTQEISDNSYFIVPFVVTSILFYGVYTIFVQILVLFKKTKIFGTIWVIAAILNVGLNILFIPRWGIMGAAITTFIAYAFALAVTWYYSYRYLNIRFKIDWSFILKSLLASVLMSFFVSSLGSSGLSNALIAIVLGAILYAILILLFKGFSKEEVLFLINFFKKETV